MNDSSFEIVTLEPERYEFASPGAYRFDLDRRRFFKLFGGGIAVFLVLKGTAAWSEPGQRPRMQREPLPQNIGAWLHIGDRGTVTVFTGKAEMGQNIRTSLTQAVAEELRVPLASIHLTMADTERTPFDLGTFGSRTTPTMGLELRRVAAVARDTLTQLAAKEWRANAASLLAENGKIRNPATGQTLEYAELARGQTLARAVVENDPLTPATKWTVAGKSVPKLHGVEFVTGRHRFSPDVKLPGMIYGKVLRPPSFGATLRSLDAREAEAVRGVMVVHDGNFAGVAAHSPALAEKAVGLLRAEWNTTPQISGRDLFHYLRENGGKHQESRGSHAEGSVQTGLAQADHRLKQTYTVAYIAHAPLETRAAVAEWKNGRVTVWTGTQRPFAVRDELSQAFHLPEDHVRVIVPDTGGAYGGKHTGEAAVEAARLAKSARRPVKLQWTREEEFTWAYFRPAGVIEIHSGVRRDGTLTAWEFHNYNSGGAGIGTPYAVSNQRIEFHPCDPPPLRQGSYRCLAATANHFARESHMDDLSRLLKIDPLDFRRKNLKDERLLAVIDAAARRFGWKNRTAREGRGFGMACGKEKGGHLATFAEVAVDHEAGSVKVIRAVSAFDCGAVVNPDGLKNQIQGALVMGLGGALFEAIEFDHGRILNNRLSRYRVPRFSDAPEIEVVLVDRKDLPSAGAGEAPIMCISPAVRNAILDATGIPLYSMPMAPDGLKKRTAKA